MKKQVEFVILALVLLALLAALITAAAPTADAGRDWTLNVYLIDGEEPVYSKTFAKEAKAVSNAYKIIDNGVGVKVLDNKWLFYPAWHIEHVTVHAPNE